MVPVAPHRAVPADHAVHRLRDAYGEPTDPTLEARRLVRFHHQVQMVRLNAELQDAETPVLAERSASWMTMKIRPCLREGTTRAARNVTTC